MLLPHVICIYIHLSTWSTRLGYFLSVVMLIRSLSSVMALLFTGIRLKHMKLLAFSVILKSWPSGMHFFLRRWMAQHMTCIMKLFEAQNGSERERESANPGRVKVNSRWFYSFGMSTSLYVTMDQACTCVHIARPLGGEFPGVIFIYTFGAPSVWISLTFRINKSNYYIPSVYGEYVRTCTSGLHIQTWGDI